MKGEMFTLDQIKQWRYRMQLLNVFDKALVQSIKAIKAKDGRLMKICNKKTIIKIKDGFNQSDDCVDEDTIFSGILKKEFLDLKDNEGQRLVD